MGIEILGGLEIHHILTKLGPKETAIVGCVSRHFRDRASDDYLWSQFCAQELHLYSPEDPLGNLIPSFKEAYRAWRESFGIYPWSLVLRVKRCWEKIKSWLVVNFPEAMTTLRKGVTEDVINYWESTFKVKLPLPTRLIYRFCDGQDLPDYGESSSSLLGLIGGYSFSNYLVNVFLLPLDEVICFTNSVRYYLIDHVGVPFGMEYLVVATSTERTKYFVFDCSSGELFIGAENFLENGDLFPCIPDDLIHSIHNVRDCQKQDGLLLWLEEHGRRLESGLVNVREENNNRYISLLPEESSLCYAAVTNGVKVRASALFIPELSMTVLESDSYSFVFSIRMSLNHGGCIVNGMQFDSCQLCMCHWTIEEDNGIVMKINEETAEGKNPILHPGEKEYVFHVHVHLRPPQGSIKASLTFVPGRLTNPKGAEFEVVLPEILLDYPDYIF